MTRPNVNLKFKKLHHSFELPKQATSGSAGIDMRACMDDSVIIRPSERVAISLGCSVEVPEGFEIQVRPRSGLALKEGITVLNTPGTIDSDYRGECKVILINHSSNWFKVQPLDRICQFVVNEVPLVTTALVEELSSTDRGEGGFGSTGTK
jgi:dUTP pyrophosphatase